MSRVHDALRRAEQSAQSTEESTAVAVPVEEAAAAYPPVNGTNGYAPAMPAPAPPVRLNIHPGTLSEVALVPFQPAPETHLLDLNNSHETPAEEFRTLRTRLNHLQTLQPLHT